MLERTIRKRRECQPTTHIAANLEDGVFASSRIFFMASCSSLPPYLTAYDSRKIFLISKSDILTVWYVMRSNPAGIFELSPVFRKWAKRDCSSLITLDHPSDISQQSRNVYVPIVLSGGCLTNNARPQARYIRGFSPRVLVSQDINVGNEKRLEQCQMAVHPATQSTNPPEGIKVLHNGRRLPPDAFKTSKVAGNDIQNQN